MSRLVLVTAALGIALALGGCKRQRAPKVEEVWDEEPAPERTEALGNLAPPWPAPTRGMLDDGLLTFWLHEPDAVAFHLRVLMSTTKGKQMLSAEQVSVVARMLRDALDRRLSRFGATIEVTHRPGRLELAIHGRDQDAAIIIRALGSSLSSRQPATALESARGRVAKNIETPRPDEVAASALISHLLALPPGIERIDAAALERLGRRELVGAWESLTDPRNTVLVVHAARPAKTAHRELRRLSDRWTGVGRKSVERSAIARLRPEHPIFRPRTRLLATPPAPVHPVRAHGRAVLMLGRVVPTPDAASRSLARLAQRVVQEEIDARLSIVGDHALFVVRVPLSSRDPDGSAEKAVDTLSELARTRHQQQRLFQAAQLWLGARVVQASLDGEDWTALWSESMDLADEDDDIGLALARDAQAMLEPDAETLKAWQSTWLDPRAGEPGWVWVVAGGDRRLERQLSRIAPVQSP